MSLYILEIILWLMFKFNALPQVPEIEESYWQSTAQGMTIFPTFLISKILKNTIHYSLRKI